MRPSPAAEPSASPTCPKHPGVPSVAPCSRCGTFLCATCRVVADPPLCEACAQREQDPLGIRSAAFSIGSALAGGWRMFQRSFGLLCLIAVVFGIPGGMLSHVAAGLQKSGETATLLAGLVFNGFIGLVGAIGAVWVMAGHAEGRRSSLGEALSFGLRSWGRVFVARFRAGLWIFAFTLLLIVPGIIKGLALMLVMPMAVLDRGGDPIEGSENLTKGFKGDMLGLSLLSGVIVLAITFPAGAVLGLAGTLVPPLAAGQAVVLDVIGRIAQYFSDAVILAAYYGLLRTRGLRDVDLANPPA